MVPLPAGQMRFNRTSAVLPIRSRTLSAMRGRPVTDPPKPRDSDVVDGAFGRPSRLDLLREVTERRAVDHSRHRARNLSPERGEVGGSGLPRTRRVPPRHLERRHPAFDGAEDLSHRDLRRRTHQLVASLGPTLRLEQTSALEEQEHLLQIALRDALPSRHLLDRHQTLVSGRLLALVDGQIEERADRVLTLRRNSDIRSRMECTDRGEASSRMGWGLQSLRLRSAVRPRPRSVARSGQSLRLRRRGLSQSWSPSPRKLNPRTTDRIASPGKVAAHQYS